MADQLLKSFEQFITPSRIENLKTILGDEPDQISSAFTASLPVVLNGVISKCSTVDGTGKIMHVLHETQSQNLLGNIDKVFSGAGEWVHAGGRFLEELFGSNENHLVDKLSGALGTKRGSTKSILTTTGLLAAGLLGKQAADNHFDNRGLIHYLQSNVGSFGSLYPAGLSAASLGLHSDEELKHKLDSVSYTLGGTGATVHHGHAVHEEESSSGGFVGPFLFIIFLGLLAWLLWGPGKHGGDHVSAMEKPHESAHAATKTAHIDSVAKTITLPNETTFHVSKGTMEYKLVQFLNDPASVAGKDVWFDFDDVNFDVDKATITEASHVQLDNIAAILKAYSSVKVKIGGYTDSTGKEARNKQLSQERADSILSALKTRAVPETQLQGAEGYGSQFATVSAKASDAERRKDRRMSLSVREE